jgi:pimeloyl-ACP methyl ester carboxylesterase
MSKTYLFIHGALHGAWCWDAVLQQLEGLGSNAFAIDLPGHGEDKTPRERITQRDYRDRIVKFANDEQLNDIVLVGHSAAGAPLTLAAPLLAGRLKKLIFLAAIVPTPGESVFDHIPEERREGYRRAARNSRDNSFAAKFEIARDIFFEDSEEKEAKALFSRLTPEPFRAYCDPVENEQFFERLPPREYILCNRDKTLPPSQCHKWALKLKVEPRVIDAGHCVMISQPELLVDTLLNCVE